MGNAIDDTLCNIHQGSNKTGLEPAYVPCGTVLTKQSDYVMHGQEEQRTSGRASGEVMQEDNKRYFSCSSPGDIWNPNVRNELKSCEADATNEISFCASTPFGSTGSNSSSVPTLGRDCC